MKIMKFSRIESILDERVDIVNDCYIDTFKNRKMHIVHAIVREPNQLLNGWKIFFGRWPQLV